MSEQKSLSNVDLAMAGRGVETFALLAIVDAINAQTEVLRQIADRLERMSYQAPPSYGVAESSPSYEPEPELDYDQWLAGQEWPQGATHATLDREGGVTWWKGEPTLIENDPYLRMYWSGELVERYHDPVMPIQSSPGMDGWWESLRVRPTTE